MKKKTTPPPWGKKAAEASVRDLEDATHREMVGIGAALLIANTNGTSTAGTMRKTKANMRTLALLSKVESYWEGREL